MTEDAGSKPVAKVLRRLRAFPRRLAAVAALAGAFALGVGATELAHRGRGVTFVALTPGPIEAMRAWDPVAIKGQVSEVFGNKFVVQDDSGRALVETGRKGEGGGLVAKAETVTVQGRFEHGFVRAVAIQHADGRTDVLDAPKPRHGPMSAFAPVGPGPDVR